MRAMFKEIGILVKEDLSNGIDNEALNPVSYTHLTLPTSHWV